MNSRIPVCVALLSALAVGACSAAQEDTGTAEGRQTSCNPCVVDPTGSDKPGQLLVTLPATPTVEVFGIAAEATTLTPNRAEELVSGKHCLRLVDSRGGSSSDCSIVITSNPTVQVDLGILQYATSGVPTLGLDFPPSESARIRASAPSFKSSSHLDALRSVSARLPGTYHYSFGLFDGVDQALEGASSQTLDFQASGSLGQRRLALIQAPTRNFPGGCRNGFPTPLYSMTARSSTGAEVAAPRFIVPSGKAFIAGDFAPSGAGSVIQLSIDSNPDLTATVPTAAPGSSPAVLSIGRIEVDDVSVTKNDGSVVKVPGAYIIEKSTISAGGVETFTDVCGLATTKTGVDVVAGKYRITTTFTTVEAGQKTDVHTLTVD